MCGIIAVVRRRGERTPPAPDDVLDLITGARGALIDAVAEPPSTELLTLVASRLESADLLLRGVPGVACLLGAPDLVAGAERLLAELAEALVDVERQVDADTDVTPLELERRSAALIRVKDAAWAVQRDRLRT